METLIVFLAIPIVWVLIAGIIFKTEFTWQEGLWQAGATLLFTGFMWLMGTMSMTADQQMIHGAVTQKVRDEGSYMESYSCNCSTRCSGSGKTRSCSTHCQTCWRRVYFVDWFFKSTIGNIQIDYDRSYSQSVWRSPDPNTYTAGYVGEPCAKWEMFENLIKGSPDSLFNQGEYANGLEKFNAPEYPGIGNIYHANGVIANGVKVDTKVWNGMIQEYLRTLGPQKQASIKLIFTKERDPRYKLAVEKAWLGGKKNDIVIVIGAPDYPKVAWVDGFTFAKTSGNYLMINKIKDGITKAGDLSNPQAIGSIVRDHVSASFKRKKMEEFEYLRNEIAPGVWGLVLMALLQLAMNIGLTWHFVKNGVNSDTGKRKEVRFDWKVNPYKRRA